ncbi:MAG: hypothetical protein GX568_08980 [Candidatus Gastranaerophilales bacterium]|nr:hypothetical protein [Candidatus Gastranaerophilales bacterium]
MTLRITCLYPEYQRVVTGCEPHIRERLAQANQTPQILGFSRVAVVAMPPGLPADIAQLSQNCKEYVKEVNNLNEKADDKQKYKTRFGFLTSKEGKPNYLKTGVYALGFIPTCRRMQSSFDAAEDGNDFRVAGMAAVAAANIPNDIRETALAYNELKGVKTQGLKAFKGQKYQHRSSFFKGTFLEPLTKRFKILNDIDKTLLETKPGQAIADFFGVAKQKKEKKIKAIGKYSKDMKAYTFKGGLFKQVIGKSLLRTNVIGVGLSTLFELPAIYNASKIGNTFSEKAKSVFKQTLKSAGNVVLITAGMGLVGGLTATTAGFTASLFGMAIGSTLGIFASKGLNKVIDKIFA